MRLHGNVKGFMGILLLVIVTSLGLAFLSRSVYAQEEITTKVEPDSAPQYIPGQLLVRFKPGVPGKRADTILNEHASVRMRRIHSLAVDVLGLPAQLPVEKALEIFRHLPEVEYAEPNYILQIAQTNETWQDHQWAPQKIQAPEAWAQIPNPAPVTIAIVDTGVDYRHSQLQPNMWTNLAEQNGQVGVDDDLNGHVDDLYGWDFYNNDSSPLDDHFHGTHVAGIAAATTGSNPASMTGVCPFCRIMAVKVMGADGSGSLDVIASGITYAADSGAKVINLSLGGSAGTATLQSAVDYAWNKGALVVAAAGNNGADTRIYPAAYPNAMAVASTNVDDYRSCFSNYGNSASTYISVSAPGESIYSTTPVDASLNDTYGTYSGTSMATPHVSGLAGLLFSQDDGRTNAQVRDLIQSTTNDLGSTGTDPYFGTGRINAYRAVLNIRDATMPPDGFFSDGQTASGYAHARKLSRDMNGTLHLVWHTKVGNTYRIRYASSSDNGSTWVMGPDVFSSSLETYHPALAVDSLNLYVAFPSRAGSPTSNYQILFTRKSLSGGAWSLPIPLTDGSYNSVRPDLYLDPSNDRLHLVASSLDNTPFVYYQSSGDQGVSWEPVKAVNPSTSTTSSNTRYAAVHASGSNIYIAARTLSKSFITTYYLHTVRSTDGGVTWYDQTKISSYQAFTTGEYGVSLAGVGDRLYMAYEVGGGLYFRRYDGSGWSNYQQLEISGAWPSITQSEDGQAWLLWEKDGSLWMRHYSGTTWDAAENRFVASGLDKRYYPNLELGTGLGEVEWVSTSCRGAPFSLVYGSFPIGAGPTPTSTRTATVAPSSTPANTPTTTPPSTYTSTPTPTDTPTVTATSTQTPTATYTRTNTPTSTPTSTNTHTATATFTPTRTSTPTFTPTAIATLKPETGFINPTGNNPNLTGDRNGFQLNPAYAYSDDGQFAVDLDSGTSTNTSCTSSSKDSHTYSGYAFNLPPGTLVQGIQVRVDAKVDSTLGSPKMCIQLSWDGGTTWTPVKTTPVLGVGEATYFLGNASDTWNHSWSQGELTQTNFKLRITNVAKSKTRDFSLDWIAVDLYLK